MGLLGTIWIVCSQFHIRQFYCSCDSGFGCRHHMKRYNPSKNPKLTSWSLKLNDFADEGKKRCCPGEKVTIFCVSNLFYSL